MAENKPSKSIEQVRQENFDRLESLRLEQASGDHPKMKANKNDKYEINESDKDLVHIRRVTRVNNPALMKYDDFEDVQSFGKVFFEQNKDSITAGYAETEIVHMPEDAKAAKNAGEAMSKIAKEKETKTDNK